MDDIIWIIVYSQEGTAGNELIENPVTFSPGTLETLEEVISRFGNPVERELWSAKMTQAIGLDGLVNWWGEVGVAASEDGSITHVLVRQAPKQE